jgi:hypothetical protein
MKEKNKSESTLMEESQDHGKEKSIRVMNAFIIGFMVGIVIYSVLANTVGLVTLIPLFIIYRLVNKPKK